MQIEEIEREIQNNQDLYSRPRIAHSVPQTAKHKDPINLYAEACLAKILKSENLAATGSTKKWKCACSIFGRPKRNY